MVDVNVRRRLSIGRILVAVVFFAAAAGCFYWVRYLLSTQSGHDHLVALLVFSIPSLVIGALVCLAQSVRMAIFASGAALVGIVLLAVIANVVVLMLK
jgi:hypothetical protein